MAPAPARIAAGALESRWNSVLGTTLALKVLTTALARLSGVVYCHRRDRRWLPGGASSTGAGIILVNVPGWRS